MYLPPKSTSKVERKWWNSNVRGIYPYPTKLKDNDKTVKDKSQPAGNTRIITNDFFNAFRSDFWYFAKNQKMKHNNTLNSRY